MNCMKSSFLAFGAVLLVTAQAGENPSNFEIVSLSNRADLISGGDALLEVRVPKNVPLNKVRSPPMRRRARCAEWSAVWWKVGTTSLQARATADARHAS